MISEILMKYGFNATSQENYMNEIGNYTYALQHPVGDYEAFKLWHAGIVIAFALYMYLGYWLLFNREKDKTIKVIIDIVFVLASLLLIYVVVWI